MQPGLTRAFSLGLAADPIWNLILKNGLADEGFFFFLIVSHVKRTEY